MIRPTIQTDLAGPDQAAPGRVRLGQTSALLLALILAGCASAPPRVAPAVHPPAPSANPTPPASGALPPAKPNQIPQQFGGYYQDDGPIMAVPYDLDALPEPVPQTEPLNRFANRPYSVFGQDYVPTQPNAAFVQEGIASWYGRKFNGKNTASGEPYDMFKLTAAHPTLPVPSYARVTNLENGKSVVVRINDRGPFHKNRVMDMSYAAAYRLGYQNRGSAHVRIEALQPGQETLAAALPNKAAPVVAATAVATAAPIVAAVPVPTVKAAPIGAATPAAAPMLATAPAPVAKSAEITKPAAAPDAVAGFADASLVSTTPAATPANDAVLAVAAVSPTPAVALPPTAAPTAPADRVWLQLGAFGSQAAAETFKTHVTDDVAGIAPLSVVSGGKKLWRVRIGPFNDRVTAGQAADKLAAVFPQRPVVMR